MKVHDFLKSNSQNIKYSHYIWNQTKILIQTPTILNVMWLYPYHLTSLDCLICNILIKYMRVNTLSIWGEAWYIVIKIINKHRRLTCPRKCSKDFTCVTHGVGVIMIFILQMRKLRNQEVKRFDQGYSAKKWKKQIWLDAKLPLSLQTQWLVPTIIAFVKLKKISSHEFITVIILKGHFWFLFGRWHNPGYV